MPLYLTFVLSSLGLLLIPGPNVAVIVAASLTAGVRQGLMMVAGTKLGLAVQLALSVIGLAGALSLIVGALDPLRWVGAAVMIVLGIWYWKRPSSAPSRAMAARRGFWAAFVLAVLNPTGIVFFVTFLPQFIDPHQRALPQLAELAVTFGLLALAIDSTFAAAAAAVRSWLTLCHSGRLGDRLTAVMLVLSALVLGLMRAG
jgi:threonine/homoserine/homoserine lactone efflux protein